MILKKVIIDEVLRAIKKKIGKNNDFVQKVKKFENDIRSLRTKISKIEKKLKEIDNG